MRYFISRVQLSIFRIIQLTSVNKMEISTREELFEEVANNILMLKTDCRLFQISMARVIQKLLNRVRREWWSNQLFIVGSVPEGLPFPFCSDLDFMVIKRNFPVVFWQSKLKLERQSRSSVMAEQNINEPAYVRLRVADKLCLNEDIRRSIDGDGYLRNKSFINNLHRDESMPVIWNRRVHGPSLAGLLFMGPVNHELAVKVDMVYSLKCRQWPPFTSNFFNRSRLNGWPSKELLVKLEGLKCLVVPIGHPNSESKEIEWRLSFSVAERELIHNMYEPYGQCMVALKIVKEMYIVYNDTEEPTPFCTYFLKTACLWMCETLPNEEYSTMNFIRSVLDWLIDRYQERHLPHYFIPKQNLIGHLSGRCCDDVIAKLTSVRTNFWEILESSTDKFSGEADLEGLNWFIINNRPTSKKMDKEEEAIFKEPQEFNYILNKSFTENYEHFISWLHHNIILLDHKVIAILLESDFENFIIDEFIQTCDHPSEILRFPEEIIMPVVEGIEEIVVKDYVEMIKTILYRKLGDLYTYLLIYLRRICPYKDLAHYRSKILHYYALGAEMVFLNKWSDEGIGGKALVVKYHYLMGNNEALKETLMKCKPVFMKIAENEDVMNRLVGIELTANSLVMRRAWADDKYILQLAQSSYGGSVTIHPVVLVFYIMARVSLKEGDRENASAILKNIEVCLRIHDTDKREVAKSLIEFIEIEIFEVTRMLGLYRWSTLKSLNRPALVHMLNQPT
ncbi:uncharacterized protein LOC117113830 [Anneissia japonica]|uniref:uncharacterized protein LOC117113830 n=1 Tax=Anneissia japonica TaxID=1529436 RepID=UPI001425992B|nr:uncharacterized protein LOC117113830 [Anneissia japonica]